MTQREKIGLAALGAVVLLGGGATLLRNSVIEPLKLKREQLAALTARRHMLEQRLAQEQAVAENWRRMAGRTIGTDRYAGHRAFRDEVHRMLEAAGLEVGSVNQLPQREVRSGFREGFVELPLSINAAGTVDQVVQFLRDFYQRPYVVRIGTMTLNAAGGAPGATPTGRNAGRSGAGEPRLSVTMQAVTLVLPTRFAPKGDPIPPGADAALVRADALAEYDEIARVNVFKLFKPPAVVVAPPLRETPRNASQPPPPPPAPPDNRKLVGTNSNFPIYVAYVVDEGKLADPPLRYELNEALDGGTVLLIHPLGMIVRVPDANGAGHTDWFYRLGAPLKDRTRLDALEPPEREMIESELRIFLRET